MESSKNNDEEENVVQIEMPNIIGNSIVDAKKILKELGLEIEVIGDQDTVVDQIPKKGIKINTGTKVLLYTNN